MYESMCVLRSVCVGGGGGERKFLPISNVLCTINFPFVQRRVINCLNATCNMCQLGMLLDHALTIVYQVLS